MAKHIDTGKTGEAIASIFLEEKGYEILEYNWRFSHAEVDIIARDNNVLVFVEVKTRSTEAFGSPEEFIYTKKEELLTDAAQMYMQEIDYTWEFRFDFISIVLKNGEVEYLKHFKDAFFPGLK